MLNTDSKKKFFAGHVIHFLVIQLQYNIQTNINLSFKDF